MATHSSILARRTPWTSLAKCFPAPKLPTLHHHQASPAPAVNTHQLCVVLPTAHEIGCFIFSLGRIRDPRARQAEVTHPGSRGAGVKPGRRVPRAWPQPLPSPDSIRILLLHLTSSCELLPVKAAFPHPPSAPSARTPITTTAFTPPICPQLQHEEGRAPSAQRTLRGGHSGCRGNARRSEPGSREQPNSATSADDT